MLTGCATVVSPKTVSENPQAWDGKKVTITGKVGVGFTIPLTDFSVFLLENPEGNVPVATVKTRTKDSKTNVTGEVWAFPARGMAETTTEAINALADFFVEDLNFERRKAREISALILTTAKRLGEGLSQFWFIIEV